MIRAVVFAGGLVVGLVCGLLLSEVFVGDAPAELSADRRSEVILEEAGDSEREPRRVAYRAGNDGAGAGVEAWLDSIQHTKSGGGRGVIKGRVATVSGDPVEGVKVRVRRDVVRPSGGSTEEASLRERVTRFVAGIKTREANTKKCWTDADGYYELTGLGDGFFHVQATKEGMELRAQSDYSRVRAGVTIDFTATLLGSIRMRVLLPDGSEPGRAQIRLRSDTSGSVWSWYPEKPVWAVQPGTYEVSARHGMEDEYQSEPVTVNVRVDQETETLTLQLNRRPGIEGIVRVSADLSIESLAVCAIRFDGARPSDRELVSSNHRTHSLGGGHEKPFRLLDLPPGQYLIGAAASGVVVATEVLTLADEVAHVELAVTADAVSKSFLRVWAKGPDGSLIKASAFSTRYQAGGSSSSRGGVTAFHCKDGSYLVPHHDTSRRQGGTHSITVHTALYGEQTQSYIMAETQSLTFQFQEAASILVTVHGHRASGLGRGVKVRLTRKKEPGKEQASISSNREFVNSNEQAVFEQVQPGEYFVDLVMMRSHYFVSFKLDEVSTVVAGRPVELSLTVPALHELTVTTGRTDLSGERCQLSASGGESVEASMNGEGKASFKNIPAGSYALSCYAAMQGAMNVKIPADSVVQLKASSMSALLVVVSDPNGPMSRTGFLNGDIIIGVDGRLIKTLHQMRQLMEDLLITPASGRRTLRVRRNGSERDLTIDLGVLHSGGDHIGGRFTAVDR